MTLNSMVTKQLLTAGLDPGVTGQTVRGALDEDLRYGPDVTSAATAAPGARAVAGVVARERGVLAGLPIALAVLDAKLSEAGAAAEIVRRTARYAKAQRTWFRADPGVVWLRRERGDGLVELVRRVVALTEGA